MKYIAILEDEHIVRIGNKPCLHCFNGQMYDYFIPVVERKKGKWIFTKTIFDKHGSTVECPSCHKKWKTYDEIRWVKENKFCPNCGAEMESGE